MPENAAEHVRTHSRTTDEDAATVARAYRLYEEELRRVNALDFNSLIFEANRLFAFPALARHYQMSYRYWLIDEFQDTNGAQYDLLRRMATGNFREIFAVADDDQTIFEWNGANIRRIGDFVKTFSCKIIQLPTNFRCPPRVVDAANRLVVYNEHRQIPKQPGKPVSSVSSLTDEEQVQCLEFATDDEEVEGIAGEISSLDGNSRGKTAVIARNRKLLEAMQAALRHRSVPAEIMLRRDEFASPQMRWFVSALKQITRPLDRRNMAVLADTFESFVPLSINWDVLLSRSESEGIPYLSVWIDLVREAELPDAMVEVVKVVADLANGRIKLRDALRQIIDRFRSNTSDGNVKEDLSAWNRIESEIKGTQELLSLDRFLQQVELRSKEPDPAPGTVSLMTIHSAKGLEFERVYLIGLAEDVLPSWHSVKKGDNSAEIEEERRECFVAITRTKKRLILSRARNYGGYSKESSRFLKEMGF